MVSFRDAKAFFHDVGDAFNSMGLLVNRLPWPLSELRSPFYDLRDWFYGADWVWDGLNYWMLMIELEASRALYRADRAITQASEAWNAIPSNWTVQVWVANALGLPSLSWYYLIRGVKSEVASSFGLPDLSWEALSAKIRSAFEWTIDLSWLVEAPLPIIGVSFVQLAEDIKGKASQLSLDDLKEALKNIDEKLDDYITDVDLRLGAWSLWSVLSPDLVDNLIDELDKKW